MKPDLAVMMHNINDLTVLLFENSYWSTNPSRSPIVEFKSNIKFKEIIPALIPNIYAESKKIEKTVRQWRDWLLGRKIRVYQDKAIDEFRHVRGKKISINNAALLKNFEFNLQTFINICVAGKITPVLMTQPNRLKDPADPFIKQTLANIERQHNITYEDYKNIYDLFNERIRMVAALNKIQLIDLAKNIPPEKEFMYDIVHLTDAGSKTAAEIIAAEAAPLSGPLFTGTVEGSTCQ